MNITIDTLPEIIVAGLVVLAAIGLLMRGLVAVARRGRAKLGSVEVGGSECSGYIAEHAAALERLEAGQTRIESLMQQVVTRTNQTDTATGAHTAALKIVTKWIRRELGRVRDKEDEINGDLDEADDELRRAADAYREGRLVGRVGP